MQLFIQGLAAIFNVPTVTLIIIGIIGGLIFGAIPGLSVTMAMVLFLPFTYSLDVYTALAVLMGIYIGGNSGGLVSAITIGIPGTAASVGTIFDGYPMMKKGLGGKALGIAVVVSSLGTFFSVLILIFLSPVVAKWALKFNYFAMFGVCLFSLTLASGLSSDSIVKGLLSAVIGISLTMIGIAPLDSAKRFTFHFAQLNSGLSMLPVLVSIYAVPEMLKAARGQKILRAANSKNTKIKGFGFTRKEFWEQKWNMLRSALIGVGVGILPGIGGATSNILAYAAAKNTSKYPEKYGTGIIDGIVATESANNASVGGAMVPLLTLGIPGDTSTAVLLSAFLIHGIQVGPLLFQTHADLVYVIFAAMMLAALLTVLIEYFGMPGFVRLMSIKREILLPIVMMFCIIGCFANNNRVFDVWIILPLGLLGYLLDKYGFPLPPLILGFVLGSSFEANLRRSLQLTKNNFWKFFQDPICCVFMILTFLIIAYKCYVAIRGTVRRRKNSS